MTEPIKNSTSLDTKDADDNMLKSILAITNRVRPPVYAPSDDSFLMLEAIKNTSLQRKRVLDMGTGSGILGLYCAMRGADVTASDIDESALEQTGSAARSLGLHVNLELSDLFSNLSAKFDLILFNPPYLPSEDYRDRSIDGGPNGVVMAHRFLKDLPAHLENSAAYGLLLLSSLNNPSSLEPMHPHLEFSIIAKRRLFFEELQVLRVRLRDNFTV